MQAPSTTAPGVEILASIASELPVLQQRSASLFSRLGREVLPLVCNWEADALESALEDFHARAAEMKPELLARRKILGFLRTPASDSARAAFGQSVAHSSQAADRMFDEVAAFAAFNRRRAATLRRLLVEMRLETDSVRAGLEGHRIRLQALDASLVRRARGVSGESGRQALGALLARSTTLQQQIQRMGHLCATASELHDACQAAAAASGHLLEVMQAQIEPAWARLLHQASRLPRTADEAALAAGRRQLQLARDEFEGWLEEAMGVCHRLREATEATQVRVERLQPEAACT